MSISIIIGTCTEDPRKLDKRPNFAANAPRTITAQIKDNSSIMRPSLALSASIVDIANYNYLHVPSWGRYYYINNIIAATGAQIILQCAIDVLTSYADAIGDLTINLERVEQDRDHNRYITDPLLPRQANRQCETIPFNRTPFAANYATDQVYLLTVMGGSDPSA